MSNHMEDLIQVLLVVIQQLHSNARCHIYFINLSTNTKQLHVFPPIPILQYEFLLCKLFNGPANDQTTLCNCAKVFYGECIRKAGVCMNL